MATLPTPTHVQTRPRRRSFSRIAAPLIAVLAASLVALQSPKPALADVTSDINTVQASLKHLREQTESLTEQFNAARIRLSAADRAAKSAAERLAAAQAGVDRMRGQMANLVRQAYMNGGGLTDAATLLTADPQQFLDRAGLLNQVSAGQAGVLLRSRVARKAQVEARAVADALNAQQRAIVADLAVRRDAIRQGMAAQQSLLGRLVVRQQQLVALARDAAERHAAQARAVALQAEAAQASLATRQFSSASADSPTVSGSGGVSTALDWARRELGKPYVYGAAGPDSFDCSGLTQYVFAKGGISLDHYTGSQWDTGRHVSTTELQPGDLVFFYSDLHHVGIYVGGGQMIDAPHSGADVRQEGVWWGDYQGAVRVTG